MALPCRASGVYGSGCLGRRGRFGYRRKEKPRESCEAEFYDAKAQPAKVPTLPPITSCIISSFTSVLRIAGTQQRQNSFTRTCMITLQAILTHPQSILRECFTSQSGVFAAAKRVAPLTTNPCSGPAAASRKNSHRDARASSHRGTGKQTGAIARHNLPPLRRQSKGNIIVSSQ